MHQPTWHEKVTALYGRLHSDHPAYGDVKAELVKSTAGLEGEKRLFYFLSELSGPTRVLKDIRLPTPQGFTHFQMDMLLLTPCAVYLFEAKHIAGPVTFNRHTGQITRGSHVFSDPIAQVERQAQFLTDWLPKPVPVIPAVIMTHPHVHVTFVPEDSPDRRFVWYPPEIGKHLEEHTTPVLTQADIDQLAAKLQDAHTPFSPNPLTQFDLTKKDIKPGIRCPDCENLTVEKQTRHWTCPDCGPVTRAAVVEALAEYVALFGPAATNRDIRAFLNIDSRSVAEKLLKKWRVDSTGSKKGFVHLIQVEEKRKI